MVSLHDWKPIKFGYITNQPRRSRKATEYDLTIEYQLVIFNYILLFIARVRGNFQNNTNYSN